MSPCDIIEQRSKATIQHGPLSQRIYLMKLGTAEPISLMSELKALAQKNDYTKIFAKVPQSKAKAFLDEGYLMEAQIPGFFKGQEAVCFLAYYLDPARQIPRSIEELESVLAIAQEKQRTFPAPISSNPLSNPSLALRPCTAQDAPAMSQLYKQVFPSYPFPIENPDYIRATLKTHIQYYAFESKGKLVALSSAEMDQKQQNVEMTDFASLPEYRGQGLAVQLLKHMEIQMKAQGMLTAYTIARAVSPGMNITFAQCGYQYNGRLINNTHISGQIESMNVWSKHL
ncbi:putative beta-lysine N-acetyltransferase [Planctomycetota bacterium]